MNTRADLFRSPILSLVMAVCLLSLYSGDALLAGQAAGPTVKIAHVPLKYFVTGYRIKIKTQVVDPFGINLVRCYFKAKGEADFVFVDMPLVASNEYESVLPAPSADTIAIDYILLAVNSGQVVVRSQTFTVYRYSMKETEVPPEWQEVGKENQILVKTELTHAPEAIPGFTDSISSDIVESAFRFGYVAEGIYIASQIAGMTLPVGATNGGLVTATPNLVDTTAAGATAAGTSAAGGSAAGAATAGTAEAGGGIGTVATVIGGAALIGGGIFAATKIFGGGVDVSFHFYNYPGTASDDTFDVTLDGDHLISGVNFTGQSASSSLKKGSHTLMFTCTRLGRYATMGIVDISNGGGSNTVYYSGNIGGSTSVSFNISSED